MRKNWWLEVIRGWNKVNKEKKNMNNFPNGTSLVFFFLRQM